MPLTGWHNVHKYVFLSLKLICSLSSLCSPFQAKREDFDSPEIANITNHVQRVYAAMIKVGIILMTHIALSVCCRILCESTYLTVVLFEMI